MMKLLSSSVVIQVCLSILLIGCTSSPVEAPSEEVKERPLISEKDGIYTEWYPGHQQIKQKGRLDEEGRKQGVWKHFTEDGVMASVTVYTDGLKDGHIVVRYPNNVVHYDGEYQMDERVGRWRFYDEEGNLVTEEDYGYPEE